MWQIFYFFKNTFHWEKNLSSESTNICIFYQSLWFQKPCPKEKWFNHFFPSIFKNPNFHLIFWIIHHELKMSLILHKFYYHSFQICSKTPLEQFKFSIVYSSKSSQADRNLSFIIYWIATEIYKSNFDFKLRLNEVLQCCLYYWPVFKQA
jgi:hypothetical protein